MGAAVLRCSVPGDLRARAARRGAVVAVCGIVVVDTALWAVLPDAFTGVTAAFWVMAGLAVAVDSRPYLLADRRASSVILPSICFTFGIVLAWGYVPAVIVQLAAIGVGGIRMRQSPRRTALLGVQHACALGGAAVVAGMTGLRLDADPAWSEALVTVGAAGAWLVARYAADALAGLVYAGLWRPGPRRRRPAQRWRLELFASAALLLLGPVVLIASRVGLAMVPLVLLALHAVHRMVRSAAEFERSRRVDELTGLPNRRALQATVAERDPSWRLALLLLDLDRFRTVNDALGHAAGDRLLVEVGRRLADSVPNHDLVVRWGGDEFAVLATRVDSPAAARRIATHLAETLGAPFAMDGLPVGVSASIGIAVQPDPDTDGTALLRQAEAAMYDAKQRGAQMALYTRETEAPDLALLADLRAALASGDPDRGIMLFYQPQIAIATGQVVGVEALLRWRHPERGMVGPQAMLRVAEHTPVMRMLTSHVLHLVVAQLAAWRASGRALRASANVSVRDLHTPGIAGEIDDLLHRYGVPPDLLQLEITESALTADPHRVLDTITRLNRIGVAISLDDFGTGYSSLQHLRRLPIAEVKVDRSFVLGMAGDPDDAAIVRSVVELGCSLGLRVVAEGVEDERTWRLLAGLGCHAAQGWFHARPMPAADLEVWLARYRPLPGALAAR